MPIAPAIRFAPRKTPQQARSTACVDAILEATIQVLLKDGMAKLTTTRIASRAGVSVGTLYQYFPNKSAVLQALLERHLDGVVCAVEEACTQTEGATLAEIAEWVAAAFVRAKFHNLDASVGLYAISDDVDGKRIARKMHVRSIQALTRVLGTASGERIARPAVAAATVFAAMAGVSRAMLEANAGRATMATMQRELTVLMRGYLEASVEMVPA